VEVVDIDHIHRISERLALTIGNFDGIHRGHRELIRRARDDSAADCRACVVTFRRHPRRVLTDSPFSLLTSFAEKLDALAVMGVDLVVALEPERHMMLSPAVFLDRLLSGVTVCLITVGENFHFGRDRSGHVSDLRSYGREKGIRVETVPLTRFDGTIISSTLIKQCIREGEMERAERLLGRPYRLTAPVVAGDGLGRRFGAPTANLDVSGRVVPERGVFRCRVSVDGRDYWGVANLGRRPAVKTGEHRDEWRFEVHIIDARLDLYGKTLRVDLFERLRWDRNFESWKLLREQINKDIEEVRKRCR
jgi:riboflavin kinase / FMN adenylyltransferase